MAAVTEPRDKLQMLARRFADADALDRPLDQKLAEYVARSREIVPDVIAAYDRLVSRLCETVGQGAPQIGEQMPEFLLPDQGGNLVSLSELIRTGPAVVSINRGHWCPYCRLELRALARAHPLLDRRGAQIVSIVPETAMFTNKLAEEHALPFKILTDVDLGYALSIGLMIWVGDEVIELYKTLGIDLPRFQGNDSWFLPIPATFVVGQDRRIRAGFVNPDFRHRMTIEQIDAALQA